MSKHRTNLDRPQRRPWAERTRSFVFAPLPLSIAWLANPLARAGLVAAGVPGLALAGPQGGSVVAGAATISNPDGSTTLINQTSQRAALDWHSFSIGSNEYVQFIQPGTSSVALNRVVGGDPSSILGSLSANGQVFLVNPSGVYFGSGATVDVAGLLATTLNIDNDDFMAGNYVFQRNLVAPDGASVVNDGVIAAREGGYVVLAGDYVENSGIVEARLGTVALAAGSAMTLDVAGDGLINFTVDGASVSQLAGVNNAGELYADGGRVIMTAKVAANLVHAAVNNSGRVQAQGVLEQDGAIYLVADGGDITLSGELDVSGPSGDGGYVRVRSTDDVTLTSGSRIDATGGAGKGGVVRVVAEQNLDFQAGAEIDVSGAPGERGGFVEVSGHQGLALKGNVRVGNDGQLLIDPANLTISGGTGLTPSSTAGNAVIGEFFIESLLQGGSVSSGANVALVATDSISFNGAFTGGDLNGNGILQGGDLFVGIGSIAGSGSGFFSTSTGSFGPLPPGFVADSDGTVNLNGVDLVVDGNLTIRAGSVTGSIHNVNGLSAGGNVDLAAVGGSISAGTGNNLTQVTAGGDVAIAASNIAVSGSTGAVLSISAGGSVDIDANVNVSASSGQATFSVLGQGIAVDGVGASPSVQVVGSGGGSSVGAGVTFNAQSGSLTVNAEVEARASRSGSGGGSGGSALVASVQYNGAAISHTGDIRALATEITSVGVFSGSASATVSLAAGNGSVAVNDGLVEAGVGATISASSGSGFVTANAQVNVSASSGAITFNNANISVNADALTTVSASFAFTPSAQAGAEAVLTTIGSGSISFTGGATHSGGISVIADARATGSSFSTSGFPIEPISKAGAAINIVAEDAVTVSGQLFAAADGKEALNVLGGGAQGAHIHVQSRNASVTINDAVQSLYGLGTGDVANNAVARVELMAGFVTGPSSSLSYHAGGDVVIGAGGSVLASAEALKNATASVDLWAVEDDPFGAPPLSGGGNVIVDGAITAVATELADGGTAGELAEADVNIEALGGTIAINAPVLAVASGSDAGTSNVGAFVDIEGGLLGSVGGPVEISITDQVEATTSGGGSLSEVVEIHAGGDVQTSGAGLVVANTLLLNPSYTSSSGGPFPGGVSNAVFDLATSVDRVGIGSNLASTTIDNSLVTTAVTVGLGASYDATLPGLVFNGGAGTQNVAFTAGGDLQLLTDGNPVNVNNLQLTAAGNLSNDGSTLDVDAAGSIVLDAAGINNSGVDLFASGDIVLDVPISVTESGATPGANLIIRALGNLTVNEALTATATGSTGAAALVDLRGGQTTGHVVINNDASAVVRAQGPGGPFPFDATVNIVNEGSGDVNLNSSTALARVSDGGPATPVGGTALVHAEALGGNLIQAATHSAIADATGGGNAVGATVELTADDQVNVSGAVTATARGSGAVTALAHIHEHLGAISGDVTVTGATVTASATETVAGPGVKTSTVEFISEQGSVTIDSTTLVTNTASATSGSAFADTRVRASGGLSTINAALSVAANAGSFASGLLDIDANAGVIATAPLSVSATELGAGTALAKITVNTANGNVSLDDLSVSASGGMGQADILIGQGGSGAIPGQLSVGQISATAVGNFDLGRVNVDLDAIGDITVSGPILATASGGSNVGADGSVQIGLFASGASADVTVGGVIDVNVATQSRFSVGAVNLIADRHVSFGDVQINANGSGSDGSAILGVTAFNGDINGGNIDIDVGPAFDDAIVNVNLGAGSGAVSVGAVDITASGGDDARINLTGNARNSINVNGPVLAVATGGPQPATGTADVLIDFNVADGGISVNGNVVAEASADYGEAEVLFTTGVSGTGGDINVIGRVEARATMTSYASIAAVELQALGSTGDINVTGDVIAANIDIFVDPFCCTNDALVDIDAVAGSVTVGGQVQALAVGLDSDGATAEVFVDALNNVVLSGGITADAQSTDNPVLASIVVNSGGNLTVGPVSASASGGSTNSEQVALNPGGTLTTTGVLSGAQLSFGGLGGFNVVTSTPLVTILSGAGDAIIDNSAFTGAATLDFNGGGYTNMSFGFGGDVLVNAVSPVSATGGFTLTGGGAVDASGVDITAGGATAVTAGTLLNLTGATVNGNSVLLEAGGALNGNGAQIAAAGTTEINAGTTLDLTGATVNGSGVLLSAATGDVVLDGATIAAATASVDVIASSNLLIGGTTLVSGPTGGVFLAAGGSVLNGPALIDGGMVGVFAGQDIDLSQSDIFIGSASDGSRLPGDPLVTDFLVANGIAVPNANPNGLFLAGNSVDLGNLDMTGHYLWVEGNQISFSGSVSAPSNVLVQLLPSDPTLTIGVEQSLAGLQQVNFGNVEHFAPFTGTTIAVGASFHLGDVFVGDQGEIDVGNKNLLFVTRNGNVTGEDNVVSNGLVALLSLVPLADEIPEVIDTIDSVDDVVGTSTGGSFIDEGTISSEGDEESDEEEGDEEQVDADGDGDDGGGEELIEQDESGDESLECA